MSITRVRYGVWALRVLTWDAVLPSCIAFAPLVVRHLFPNRRGAVELAAILLPVSAFLLRLRAGRIHIASNRCSRRFQRVQFLVLFLGIVPLVLIDCVVILSEIIPGGAFGRGDLVVLAGMIGVYLAAMVVAMYPGREDVPDDAFAVPETSPDLSGF